MTRLPPATRSALERLGADLAVARLRRQREMGELFRRMVFDILVDNTRDHEKNYVLLSADP